MDFDFWWKVLLWPVGLGIGLLSGAGGFAAGKLLGLLLVW